MLGALLLGAAVLCLLYPVVRVESGAAAAAGAARRRAALRLGVRRAGSGVRRGAATRRCSTSALLRSLPGYLNGLAVGALYFTGFTGVLLVTSLYLQEGLGLTPLEAGLLMMPFAAGSAISAPLAGRVVPSSAAGSPSSPSPP